MDEGILLKHRGFFRVLPGGGAVANLTSSKDSFGSTGAMPKGRWEGSFCHPGEGSA